MFSNKLTILRHENIFLVPYRSTLEYINTRSTLVSTASTSTRVFLLSSRSPRVPIFNCTRPPRMHREYLREVSLMSISVTLADSPLGRFGGMIVGCDAPARGEEKKREERRKKTSTESRPCGSCHDTHGPRITN